MGVSENAGPQQPWVFLLNMLILGRFGVPPFLHTEHLLESLPGERYQGVSFFAEFSTLEIPPRGAQTSGLCWWQVNSTPKGGGLLPPLTPNSRCRMVVSEIAVRFSTGGWLGRFRKSDEWEKMAENFQ